MTPNSVLQQLKRALLLLFVFSFTWLQTLTVNPAQAEEQQKYVDSEGKDLTALVECLPQDYNKADLSNAIAKFGNDYIERVFRLKENTEDYKVSKEEQQIQECLKSKGIRPKS